MIEKAERKKLRKELNKLEAERSIVGKYEDELTAYMNSDEFVKLNNTDRGLIYAQNNSMFAYSNILYIRITRILDRLMEQ